MQTSKAGLQYIESFESKENKAYYDHIGVLTCGIGCTNAVMPADHKITPDTVWTDDECYYWLSYALQKTVEAPINRLVKVELTQNQFDAVASLVYNIGEGNFAKSTLLKYLNAGRFDLAQREFLKWNRAGGQPARGLTRRRLGEAVMFGGGLNRAQLITMCLAGVDPDIAPKRRRRFFDVLKLTKRNS